MPAKQSLLSDLAFSSACIALVVLAGFRIQEHFASPRQLEAKIIEELATPVELPVQALHLQGSKAELVVIEASDFECPFCAQHYRETYSSVKRELVDTGRLAYGFVHFPLAIHENARAAAAAAECAGDQDRFWEMHDVLFAEQHSLAARDMPARAKGMGLNTQLFERCIADAVMKRVDEQIKLATSAGVKSTPTFLIGRLSERGQVTLSHRIVGSRSLDVMKQALQEVAQGLSINWTETTITEK